MPRFPKAAPGEGERRDFETWSYWSIARGEQHYAYVAGECVWLICHPSERTKPCLRWWTKGELPCKLCGKNTLSVELGYFPVWRATDWRPKFVIVYAPEREQIDKLRLHQRVMIGKEDEKGAANYVRPAAQQEPAFNTTREDRKKPADITHSLLIAWEIPELTMWCAGRRGESDSAVSLDLGGQEEKGPVTAESLPPLGDQPYTGPDRLSMGGSYDDVLKSLKRRAAERDAEKNGKHG